MKRKTGIMKEETGNEPMALPIKRKWLDMIRKGEQGWSGLRFA